MSKLVECKNGKIMSPLSNMKIQNTKANRNRLESRGFTINCEMKSPKRTPGRPRKRSKKSPKKSPKTPSRDGALNLTSFLRNGESTNADIKRLIQIAINRMDNDNLHKLLEMIYAVTPEYSESDMPLYDVGFGCDKSKEHSFCPNYCSLTTKKMECVPQKYKYEVLNV